MYRKCAGRSHCTEGYLSLSPLLISLRGYANGKKSEEKLTHHQDSNQGPSLEASDALTTELWCSCHPSRDRSTFSPLLKYILAFVQLPCKKSTLCCLCIAALL